MPDPVDPRTRQDPMTLFEYLAVAFGLVLTLAVVGLGLAFSAGAAPGWLAR